MDGKAETAEEKEKPKEAFTGGKKGIANIAQAMDRTLASKLFPDLLQRLQSFLILLQTHLASYNV